MSNLIASKAMIYGCKCHDDVNQKYDDQPYSVHLTMVAQYVQKYKHLAPEGQLDICESAAWLHDTIEDTRKTYNDIRDEFGYDIAEVVYALTNEKGRNREERENEKYFNGIKNNPCAHFVKICDRLANIKYSGINGSRMFYVYRRDFSYFKEMLFDQRYIVMFNELEQLLNR